jgi:predicted transcriptional regulator
MQAHVQGKGVKMLTVQQMREALADRNIREVAKRSGISEATIYRALRGQDIKVSTLARLSAYLEGTCNAIR